MSTLGRRLAAIEDAVFADYHILADVIGAPFSLEWASGAEEKIAELLRRGLDDQAVANGLADHLGVTRATLDLAMAKTREAKRGNAR